MAGHEWAEHDEKDRTYRCSRCGSVVTSYLEPWDRTVGQPFVLTFFPADEASPGGWGPDPSAPADCDEAVAAHVLGS